MYIHTTLCTDDVLLRTSRKLLSSNGISFIKVFHCPIRTGKARIFGSSGFTLNTVVMHMTYATYFLTVSTVCDDEPFLICSLVNWSDRCSAASDVFNDFFLLKNCKCQNGETLKNNEFRFAALKAKLNPNDSAIHLSRSVSALYLLFYAALYDSGRVSVLSFAICSIEQYNDGCSKVSTIFSSTIPSTTEILLLRVSLTIWTRTKRNMFHLLRPPTRFFFESDFPNVALITNISYDTVDAVIRQCDANNTNGDIISATYANIISEMVRV